MNTVVDFINDVIEKEYSAKLAYFTERDNNILNQKLVEYHKYWKEAAFASVKARKDNIDEEWFEESKKTVEMMLYKRVLFQVKEYDNDVYGKLYRCYLSDPAYPELEYYENYFVASINNEYKIVAVYYIKDDLESLSTSLSKWKYYVGDKIGKLGKPTDIFKNVAPEEPMHLKEYEKE